MQTTILFHISLCPWLYCLVQNPLSTCGYWVLKMWLIKVGCVSTKYTGFQDSVQKNELIFILIKCWKDNILDIVGWIKINFTSFFLLFLMRLFEKFHLPPRLTFLTWIMFQETEINKRRNSSLWEINAKLQSGVFWLCEMQDLI